VQELARLAFSADEWETLQADHRRLSNAAGLLEAVEYAVEALSEGEAAALATVGAVVSRLKAAAGYDPGLKEALDVLDPALIQIQEAVYTLRHYRSSLDLDPRRLQELEQRLEAIHSTSRKYRITPDRIPETLKGLERRLEELGGGSNPEQLAQREAAAEQTYRSVAGRLTKERQRAARELTKQVSTQMQNLAMAGGRFEVALTAIPEGTSHGMEQIDFLVASNPGTPTRPLSKVASGGELSRLSLAIQTVTSAVAEVSTLVFDEVDAGIGGRVAEIVGRMLGALGARHQVMCITHLPQVAAAADQQWQVSKTQGQAGVRSNVRVLDHAERVEEVARMLGGVKITETTRKHAAEMVDARTSNARS